MELGHDTQASMDMARQSDKINPSDFVPLKMIYSFEAGKKELVRSRS